MVILIEIIRRFGREWDRYIVRREARTREARALACAPRPQLQPDGQLSPISSDGGEKRFAQTTSAANEHELETAAYGYRSRAGPRGPALHFWARNPGRFRPSLLQQAVRSLIYAIQFTGAYLVMLIAMTFNGYIIMVICLGGLFGHFISTWDALAFTFASDDGPVCPIAAGEIGPTRTEINGLESASHHMQSFGSHNDPQSKAGPTADASYGHGTCC